MLGSAWRGYGLLALEPGWHGGASDSNVVAVGRTATAGVDVRDGQAQIGR